MDAHDTKELSQLRLQNSELRRINATKDEFIALASHQLRTPATGVKQYLGMLLEGYMGKLTPAQKEFLQRAYDSNERQLNTINDLLQVAQLDANKVVLNATRCDVVSLVGGVVQDQRSVVKARSQRILWRKPKEPIYVYADALRLRMVFDNVIDNASKYSPEHRTITVSVKIDGRVVTVCVADRGVGIAQHDFNKLFQKFSRIDNSRSIMVGGNGLGLYLAKRIMHVHRGDIDVQSVLGSGSVFTITLPQAEEPAV